MSTADNPAIGATRTSAPTLSVTTGTATSRDLVLRIGGCSGVIGALLALVANVLHPHPANFQMETVLDQIARSSAWGVIHLTLLVALMFVFVALVALTLSLEREPAATIGRIACVLALLGGVLLLVSTAIDGFAMNRIAEDWVNAPAGEKAAALRTATALEDAMHAVYSLSTALFLGLGIMLYGFATLLDRYPKWLAWLAILGGAGEVAVGLVQLLSGPTYRGAELPDALFSVLITVWLLIMGILLWRTSQVRRLPPGQAVSTPAGP